MCILKILMCRSLDLVSIKLSIFFARTLALRICFNTKIWNFHEKYMFFFHWFLTLVNYQYHNLTNIFTYFYWKYFMNRYLGYIMRTSNFKIFWTELNPELSHKDEFHTPHFILVDYFLLFELSLQHCKFNFFLICFCFFLHLSCL